MNGDWSHLQILTRVRGEFKLGSDQTYKTNFNSSSVAAYLFKQKGATHHLQSSGFLYKKSTDSVHNPFE